MAAKKVAAKKKRKSTPKYKANPGHIQRKLQATARKKFPGNQLKQNQYVFGTMTKKFGHKGSGKH